MMIAMHIDRTITPTTKPDVVMPKRNESTASEDALPSTADESTESMSIESKPPSSDQPISSLLPVRPDAAHTIVCREWKTETVSAAQEMPYTMTSMIPEKDAVLWLIKDFAAFRSAAKVSHIPPLVSPEFGGGCKLRLWLWEKKGHILGSVELPIMKASRDGVAHFQVTVVKPDLKVTTRRKVEMRVTTGSDKKLVAAQRTSTLFRLTKARCAGSPKYEHLVVGDCMRIRVEFEYFPFDAPIFRGFGRVPSRHSPLESRPVESPMYGELLKDIRNFCRDDPTQNVEIKKNNTVFNACRFLLCSRSKRFREIFGNGGIGATPLSARGSPSARFGLNRSSGINISSLSSITIQDVTTETLDQMLTFIHTDSCPYIEDVSTDILKVIDLFEAADSYGIEALVSKTTKCLSERMDNENFVFMLEASERASCDEFKRMCTEYMDSLPGSQVASLMRANSSSPRIQNSS